MQVVQRFLDGAWDFQLDPTGAAAHPSSDHWRLATVPSPWQAQFDDLRNATGAGWYRRRFNVEETISPDTDAVILHFGAVDYYATVWLNGVLIGDHEGGYLPFEFDVAKMLRKGENELLVRAVDASDDRTAYPDWPFSEVPHGKQSWYGPIGGIWQSVWLEVRPKLHIVAVRLTPSPAAAEIAVQASLSGALPANGQLAVTVYAPTGEAVAKAILDANADGKAALSSAPALWSVETPNLYTVEVVLSIGGAPQHATRNTCGFRTVEARDGRIYLNGNPIYLRGVLDQAYYPGTVYTPPGIEFLEDQVRKAKALGLNCLRTHIKIEDPRYYEVADRLGILIWTEIPNWVLLSPAADRRIKATFRGMVERDWNHPSIIAWTLVNENWGTDLARNPEHRRWLTDFYHEAKTIDPTRLIIDNSACCDNFHVAGDLEDFHAYRAIPDHAAEWDQWVSELASRENDWVWAPDYGQERRADLPLIVSEFGNWGLPNPDEIQEQGKDPWWFETGHEWDSGIVYPHGMRERFSDHGLAGVFGTLDNFALDAQAHMARSLHYEITSMRLQPAIAGYIITEFTDVHWECNGLLTMQRQVKHGLDTLLAPMNQDRVVTIRPANWSGRPGENVDVDLRCFDVNGASAHGTIRWQCGSASGELAAPGGSILAPLHAAGIVRVEAHWIGADGATIATNSIELACVEPQRTQQPLCVIDDPELVGVLRSLGYAVHDLPLADAVAQGVILVARHYTPALQTAVQQGGRLVLLAGAERAPGEIHLPAGYVVPRAHTPWQGDWATAFSWLKKQGPFAGLPGAPLLEMEYAEIMPDAVIVRLPPWAMRTHSWAGLALGWIHSPVSLLFDMPYGRGHVAVTTFKLEAATLARNAIAQSFWDGILRLV